MRIHALSTGTVRLKHSFLNARTGWRRQVDLLLPGEGAGPVTIHCWAVQHDGRLLVVDAGETVGVRNIPFARFQVGLDDELPGRLAAAGLNLADADTVVL